MKRKDLKKVRRNPKPYFTLKKTDAPHLDKLPIEQLSALTMVHRPGKTYQMVAADCSVPIGTIKSRVNRAREAVKAMRAKAEKEASL